MHVVHRPRGAADAPRCLDELRAAMAGESIARGEAFGVVSLAAPTTNDLGPFARDSDTSRDAALDNYPRTGTQRHRVLEALRARPAGLTRDELTTLLHLPDSTVDPRVWELVRGGWVVETARKRPTRTGSEARVLELTAKGRECQPPAP